MTQVINLPSVHSRSLFLCVFILCSMCFSDGSRFLCRLCFSLSVSCCCVPNCVFCCCRHCFLLSLSIYLLSDCVFGLFSFSLYLTVCVHRTVHIHFIFFVDFRYQRHHKRQNSLIYSSNERSVRSVWPLFLLLLLLLLLGVLLLNGCCVWLIFIRSFILSVDYCWVFLGCLYPFYIYASMCGCRVYRQRHGKLTAKPLSVCSKVWKTNRVRSIFLFSSSSSLQF